MYMLQSYGSHWNWQNYGKVDQHAILKLATSSLGLQFINLISGSNLRVGMGLDSCTSEVETSLPFTLGGRHVILIDTPGFNDTTQSDTAILRLIADFLSKQLVFTILLL